MSIITMLLYMFINMLESIIHFSFKTCVNYGVNKI